MHLPLSAARGPLSAAQRPAAYRRPARGYTTELNCALTATAGRLRRRCAPAARRVIGMLRQHIHRIAILVVARNRRRSTYDCYYYDRRLRCSCSSVSEAIATYLLHTHLLLTTYDILPTACSFVAVSSGLQSGQGPRPSRRLCRWQCVNRHHQSQMWLTRTLAREGR